MPELHSDNVVNEGSVVKICAGRDALGFSDSRKRSGDNCDSCESLGGGEHGE